MSDIICGDLEFQGIKYKFDFRDNVLVLLPENMENYSKWYFNHTRNNKKFGYEFLEGTTNNGYYICFIKVKFSNLGRGSLQAFVPGYVLCKANAISPLPKCENIEKIRIYGECLDKFYYPKQIVETSDFFNTNEVKALIKSSKMTTTDFTINKDKFSFGISWKFPCSSDINVVLDVSSYLEVEFDKNKNITELVDYFLNIKKFFEFVNNRKYVNFKRILAYRTEDIDYGFDERPNMQKTPLEFEFFFVDPEEEFDFGNSIYALTLDNIKNKFSRIYKEVTKKSFLAQYYPLSKKDERYIDNNKYIEVASAFESEFDKLNPNFKTNTSEEYNKVKKSLLNSLSNKRYLLNNKIKKLSDSESKKELKSSIKYCDYFSDIIKNIDGTLSEKINFSFKKYQKIIDQYKQILFKNYDIKKCSIGSLADAFSYRRNKISHGREIGDFTSEQIISYELLRICIYCITFERCGFTADEIKEIINKIFNPWR